jgi:hypothetical protein
VISIRDSIPNSRLSTPLAMRPVFVVSDKKYAVCSPSNEGWFGNNCKVNAAVKRGGIVDRELKSPKASGARLQVRDAGLRHMRPRAGTSNLKPGA